MAVIPPELAARVADWVAGDPDPGDRAELAGLAGLAAGGDEAAVAELADRFRGRLTFGTAGLRGAMGAGPSRMNRAVVRSATAALAGWLRGRDPAAAAAGVVIGCDARHRSAAFAGEAAATLAGAGIRALMLPERQPTPLLAFAVRHLRAAAGIMITASHNPAGDNGYKLYLADGAQIVPPADAEIEAAIAAAGPLAAVPVAGRGSPLITRLGDEVAQAYLNAVCGLSPAPPGAAGLRAVYTPLHGVAAGLALRAFGQAGFAAPEVVAAQAGPDPDFPTVAFPNPEEPGALDEALALGRAAGADLVLANDPDGDRLAVAVPCAGVAGGWQVLTGDQVGALLGAYLLGYRPDGASWGGAGGLAAGRAGNAGAPVVVTTIVSASLLSRIAAAAGARYAETLTGFKWIVRAGGQGRRGAGPRFAFGYEEALGYCVGTVVRDKDGIGAALAVLGLAARARARGESLLDVYDALEMTHGVHLTAQVTVRTSAPETVMGRLRRGGPASLGGLLVSSVTDLAAGVGGLPPADVLICRLPGARVVIRPSGTEPKIKVYLQVVEPVRDRRLDLARERARARLAPLRDGARDLLLGAAPAAGN